MITIKKHFGESKYGKIKVSVERIDGSCSLPAQVGDHSHIEDSKCIKRSELLKELAEGRRKPFPLFLYGRIRIIVPAAILFVGINWLLESILNTKIFG